MPKRKKVFECGHRGFGQFCHTCEQLAAGELRETDEGSGRYFRPKDAEVTNGKRSKARAAVRGKRIGRAPRKKKQ